MKLVLKNFRHHRNKVIEFPAQGVVLLSGVSGIGKSTIFTALEFVLYGKVRKVSSFGESKTSVQLFYEGTGLSHLCTNGRIPERAVITRSKDPNLLQLQLDQGLIYQDEQAQALINAIFGTEEVFLASSYLRQGEKSQLLEGKSLDKLSLMESLAFHGDDISKYKELISKHLLSTEKRLLQLQGSLQVLQGQVENFKTLHCATLRPLQEEKDCSLEKVRGEITTLEEKRKNLQSQIKHLEEHEHHRDIITAQNQRIEQQIRDLTTKLPCSFNAEELQETQSRKEQLEREITQGKLAQEYYLLWQEYQKDLQALQSRFQTGTFSLERFQELEREKGVLLEESAQYQALKRRNGDLLKHNETVQRELSLLPLVSSSLEELEEEGRIAHVVEEYNHLLSELEDYLPLEEVSPPPELREREQLYYRLRALQEQNQEVREKLRNLQEQGLLEQYSVEYLLEQSTREKEYQEYLSLQDLKLTPLDPALPQDRSSLLLLEKETKRDLALLQGLNLQGRTLTSLREDLSQLVEKVPPEKLVCPSCNSNLLYRNHCLTLGPKAVKPLPSRLGKKKVEESTSSQVPVENNTPELSPEEVASLQEQIKRVEEQCSVLTSLPSDQEQYYSVLLQKIEEGLSLLSSQEAQKPLFLRKEALNKYATYQSTLPLEELERLLPLARKHQEWKGQLKEVDEGLISTLAQELEQYSLQKERYQKYLEAREKQARQQILRERLASLASKLPFPVGAGIIPFRSVKVIKEELAQVREREELLKKIAPLEHLDEGEFTLLQHRLKEVEQEYLSLQRLRQEEELRQQCLVHQEKERKRRLNLLLRLHPSLSLEEVMKEDEKTPSPPLELEPLTQALQKIKERLSHLLSAQRITEQIYQQKALLHNPPPSLKETLAQYIRDLTELNQKLEQSRALEQALQLNEHLSRLEGDLENHTRDHQEETKRYALLGKLKEKALLAEASLLQEAIKTINIELAQQLDKLFDLPITVRLETVKQMKNGLSKPCINLSINYRDVSYDDVSQLSGGESARVSLAILLALNHAVASPLLLLDESLSALDGGLIDTVIEALKETAQERSIPIIMTLHNSCCGYFDEVIALEE